MGRMGGSNYENQWKESQENLEKHIGILGGASDDITASCYSFELDKIRIQIDGGSFQGRTTPTQMKKMYDKRGETKPQYTFGTHVHCDHISAIPIQAKNEGFPKDIKFITSPITKAVAPYVYRDGLKLQGENILKYKKKSQLRSQILRQKEQYNDIYLHMIQKDYFNTDEMKEGYLDDFQSKSNGKKDKGTGEHKRRGRHLTQLYNNIPEKHTREKLHNKINDMNRLLETLEEFTGDLSSLSYDEQAIKFVVKNTTAVENNQPFTLIKDQFKSNVVATLYHTGHITGANSVLFELLDTKTKKVDFSLMFSGDIGREAGTPFQEGFAIPENKKIDTLVVEATYGDKNHTLTYKEALQNLTNKVNQAKGPTMIYAISYQKFQEILVTLLRSTNKTIHCFGQLPKIYSQIFAKINPEFFGSLENNPRIIRESQRYEDDPLFQDPEVVCLATSGMMAAAASMIARAMCNNSNATIISTNHQAVGTPGYRFKEKREVMNENGTTFGIFKGIYHHIEGLSGHGDQKDLISYIMKVGAKVTIITHGEMKAKLGLKAELEKAGYTGKIIIPTNGDKVHMVTGKISE